MVDPTTRNIIIAVYAIIIISIFVVVFIYTRPQPAKPTSSESLTPSIPINPITPGGDSDSYFKKDSSFTNQPTTQCMTELIEKFRNLVDPIELHLVDKGAHFPKLVANDKNAVKTAWNRLCNAINTGITTCPDMRVRYIVPQGAGEQIDFINDKGKVYIPENSRFYCIDTHLYPIYFRLNHKGAGVTFAVNIPDFS